LTRWWRVTGGNSEGTTAKTLQRIAEALDAEVRLVAKTA
jgi:hypothetical protein